MANKTVTVKPSGGTYTTLAAVIAGELIANADLTAMAGILNIEISGDWSGGADTALVYITGFTESADYYLNIYTDSANQVVKTGWDATRHALAVSDVNVIEVRQRYTRIDGLQIQYTYTDTLGSAIIYQSIAAGGTDIRISNCRIRQAGTADKGNGITIGDVDIDNALISNCIITGGFNRGLNSSGGSGIKVWQSVVYGMTGGYGFRGVNTTIKNSALFATADDIRDDGGCTIDYNATDDNDGTNNVAESGGGATWPSDFADAANGNFTLLVDSNLNGGGTTSIIATDMDGDAYGDPASVGADEYVAAGGGQSPVPIILQMLH